MMTSKMNLRFLLNERTLGILLVMTTVVLHRPQLVRATKQGSRQTTTTTTSKSNARTSVSSDRMKEIDLLEVIRIPFPSKSLSYVVGYDGFPAFGFGERADVKSPYRLTLPERLYRDFSVLATVRTESSDGGFLFAVVNPSATIVQLGVRLSSASSVGGLRNVSLYYTDVEMHVVSQVIAMFAVPLAAKQWVRLAVRVAANNVTLYVDCEMYQSAIAYRTPRQLLFDSASTLYIGQAGPLIRGRFLGAIQELKISNNPGLAEVQCYDVHYPAPITTFPDNGDARGDMDIDDVQPNHDAKPGISTSDTGSSLQPGPPPLITPPPPGPTGDLDADSSSGFISMIGGSGDGSGMGPDDQMFPGLRGPPGPRGPPGVCSCNMSEFMDFLPVPDTRANGVPGLSGDVGANVSQGTIAGPKGDVGPVGPKGDKGDRGEVGLPGPPGRNNPFYDGSGGGTDDDPFGLDGMMGRPIRNGIGPQGPAGDDGLPGLAGEKGEPGPVGDTGPSGKAGVDGAQGSKGDKGDKGDPGVGEPGPPGPAGNCSTCDTDTISAGAKGDVGPQGPPGLTGLMGLDGQPGGKGEKGSLGVPGSDGSKGEAGEPGLPGKVVQLGDSIAYVQGDKGARGEHGKRGRRGKLGPPGVQGAAGKPGTPGEIGIPGFPGRSGKQGPPGAAVKGDKGDPGPSCSDVNSDCGGSKSLGPPGEKGSKGDVGPPGTSKNDGFYPVVGLPGPPGPPGPPGLSIEGEKGTAGVNGQPGRMGSPGPPGPPGFGRLGPPGPQGPPGPPGNPGQASSDNYISPNIVPGAVTFKDLNAMLKMSRVSPVGTLAYIIDEQALLVRVNNGWQYVALGTLVSIPTEAPVTSTTHLPAQIMPQVDSLVVNGPSLRRKLRMAALNEPHVGDMHGVRGADYACYRQARLAGIRGTFRAFLSSRVQNLDSIVRYTDRGLPVVNIRGDPLFSSWKEIFAGAGGQLHYQARIYSFDGRSVLTDNSWPQKLVWHGSNRFGARSMDSYCDAWHSNNKDKLGLASSLLDGKLLDEQKFSCNNAYIVLCVEATSQNEVTAASSSPSPSSRRKRRDAARATSDELSAAEYELYLQEIMDDNDDNETIKAATL